MAKLMPAIFLDRDGTINIDHGYVYKIDNFHFIDGVIDALRQLKTMGYLLVLVTNQSGIARGKFSEEQFMQLTEWMDWSLADRGVELDGIYFCPHLPQAECDCRKPQPGMLLEAAKYLHIDMANSYMVGDKTLDIMAGIAAKVGHNILVKTGKAIDEEGVKQAEAILASLVELPSYIKSHNNVNIQT